jgi:AcrR family transcriptional regulator
MASRNPTVASPRKDAARNRARLVAAAREVFAEHGLAATLDDVAARAGVGTGTAYRNFADKHELAAVVLAEATQHIADDAYAALGIDDPWTALVTFFETTAARQAADRSLYESLAGQGRKTDKIRIWPDIVAAVTRLFDRARKAGVVRPDVRAEDAVAVFAMLGAVDDWRRYLVLLLDGMRPEAGAAGLPGTAGRFESLDDVIAVSKQQRRAT